MVARRSDIAADRGTVAARGGLVQTSFAKQLLQARVQTVSILRWISSQGRGPISVFRRRCVRAASGAARLRSVARRIGPVADNQPEASV
eukprot:4572652-Pleurochrysis_carterae.AAC.1